MRKLIYSMGVSLDGYTQSPTGDIDFTDPDDELHRFHNERVSGLMALYGRKLYEDMSAYWPTADEQPDAKPVTVDFAKLWRAQEKVVFSSTLDSVGWNSRLHRGDVVEEVRRLKAEDGQDMEIGGATVAAPVVRAGLVDEFQIVFAPAVLGGGTPYFPLMDSRIQLRRMEVREFASAVVHRYEVRP